MDHPLSLFKFCPKCGSSKFEAHNFKSNKCETCGFTYYFNPSAATVAIIVNSKGQLLVCKRAKEPAKGTLDLPGGFVDMDETGEEAVAREVKEETNLRVKEARFLFSLPNLYRYSGFLVHTLDLFYLCKVDDCSKLEAADDVAESYFMDINQLDIDAFGLSSIKKGLSILESKNIL